MVNTSLAVLNPYVLDAPIGSQITQSKKSTSIKPIVNLNMNEYNLGGR